MALDWLPSEPDVLDPDEWVTTDDSTPFAFVPIPAPAPPITLWNLDSTFEGYEDPADLDFVDLPLPRSFVVLTPFGWLPLTDADLDDPEDRPPFDAFHISGILAIPTLMSWLPTGDAEIEDEIPLKDLAEWQTSTPLLVDVAGCIELRSEAVTNPALSVEALTRPALTGEILTLPTLTAEDLC